MTKATSIPEPQASTCCPRQVATGSTMLIYRGRVIARLNFTLFSTEAIYFLLSHGYAIANSKHLAKRAAQ